jgi:hypothetical protein
LRGCTRGSRLSGWRETDLEEALQRFRKVVGSVLSPEDERAGAKEHWSDVEIEGVTEATRLQLIACHRAGGAAAVGEGSVFSGNEREIPSLTQSYIQEMAQEFRQCLQVIECGGKQRKGEGSKQTRKAAMKLTAYHGSKYTENFFHGDAIERTLQGEGVKLAPEELQEIFPRGVRLHFAVGNIKNPLEAVVRCARHVKETLTDEKIERKLKEEGVEIPSEEIPQIFTRGVRLYFAVGNIGNPLEAVVRCARHVKETLTDEKIGEKLKEEGVEIPSEEIPQIFTRGVRLRFAVNNIKNPLEAVVRCARHVKETLTDEKIGEKLKKEGVEVSEKEFQEIFPRGVRLHFAVGNIKNPLEAVVRCARHVKETLTDEKIGEKLKEEGVEVSEKEFQEIFPRGVRLHFAVYNISDPLKAVVRWIKGEISIPWGTFEERRKRYTKRSQ